MHSNRFYLLLLLLSEGRDFQKIITLVALTAVIIFIRIILIEVFANNKNLTFLIFVYKIGIEVAKNKVTSSG